MDRKFLSTFFKSKKNNEVPESGIRKTDGKTVPEKAALKPEFIRRVGMLEPERVLFVTGTNGKTTVTNLIAHILSSNGFKVISSVEGADIVTGEAADNVKAPEPEDIKESDFDFCLIEIEERYLGMIADQLPCANLLVTNLQQNQVQRNGDPDFIYRRIERAVEKHGFRLFLNADEPRSASLAAGEEDFVFFGAVKHELAFTKGNAFVTMPCPNCRHGIEFRYYNNAGMGGYSCPNCGYCNPKVDYLAEKTDFRAGVFRIKDTDFLMPYAFPDMLYNYTAATAFVCELTDISLKDASIALASFSDIGGSLDAMSYRGMRIKYMRLRQDNPETLQNFINTIAADRHSKVVAVGFGTADESVPEYINSFYAYDCDYSRLLESDIERFIFVTDTVCFDAANSFIYGGVDPAKVEVIPTDDEEEILEAMWNAGCDNAYLAIGQDSFDRMKAFADEEVVDFDYEYEDEYEYEEEDENED